VNHHVSIEEAAFREEVRTWLSEHTPGERPTRGPEVREFDLQWQRTQFNGGWAGITWPVEYGGRGLTLFEQVIWYEECARARVPDAGLCSVGINHAGPTLIACADKRLQVFHLPKILRGDVGWCQGFSEPGAGSDLAGLSLHGVVDGDELIVNGQKIWTSLAQFADYQELLVRTDRSQGRHKGITWTICDMHAEGVEVRTIKSLTGEESLAEVFYKDVRIPLSNVVGEMGDGWRVAMSTLSFERGTAFMKHQLNLVQDIERIISAAESGRDVDDAFAERLALARAEARALGAMTLRTVSRNAKRELPGPDGSVVRLFYSELNQRVARLALDIAGAGTLDRDSESDSKTADAFYKSLSGTIAAGTKDIQRNIIGERLLGLPR
jgi:alkylation response protein AidB-like acyl-CoA dehydrogenase